MTPNDFADLPAAERRLGDFERLCESVAKPFERKFTRRDLAQLMRRLAMGQGAQRPENT
ncbi:MAG: hypothetical protein M3072_09205 [Candidatus Dormibacteraeota bacterium]|nr:hypothetical protein [Candidatus Dormibacteraeota bacterium]